MSGMPWHHQCLMSDMWSGWPVLHRGNHLWHTLLSNQVLVDKLQLSQHGGALSLVQLRHVRGTGRVVWLAQSCLLHGQFEHESLTCGQRLL